MKFVIDNYSDINCSQALYLQSHINSMDEHECILNNSQAPFFDVMDSFNPDVYISSWKTINMDIINYIKGTKNAPSLMINIESAKSGSLRKMFEILKDNNIKYKMFHQNESPFWDHATKKESIRVLNAVDINIDISSKIKWKNKINYLLICRDKEEIKNLDLSFLHNKTFHIYSSDGGGDIHTSIISVAKTMLHNYENIIITGINENLDQIFFEAMYRGDRVYFLETKDKVKAVEEKIHKIFKTDECFNFLDKDRTTDFSVIKKSIELKHTSLNRSKTILSQVLKKNAK